MKTLVVFSSIFYFLLLFIECNKNETKVTNLSKELFKTPPLSTKVHTWWHWLDGAITKEGITKDLETMKQQGIVQATILNVGLFDGKDFGVPKVTFASDKWFEMFRWALQDADRLGIKIGAHNCDGWSSSGGPWITPEKSMKQYVWTKTILKGSRNMNVKLPKPFAEKDYYVDVAVVAYNTDSENNSFQLAQPKVTLNTSAPAAQLFDGDPNSAVTLKKGDKIQIAFDKDFMAEKLVIHPRRRFMWNDMNQFLSKFTIYSSIDGKNFKKIKDIEIKGLNKSSVIELPVTTAKFFNVELNAISEQDAWIEFTVAELELIKSNENPTFSPTVPYLLEKTVSVKSSQRKYFDIADTINNIGKYIPENKIVILTDKMSADGTLQWNAPEGNWCIIRFGYTTTGATNGPATKEGIGLECDKMDTSAMNLHFKSFPQKLIDNAGKYSGNTFKFILIDSWECGYQNWTNNFPAEFEKLRGYSITSWIPVLCGETIGNAELSEAFLYDFRKTIGDLIERNYYKQFADLCHKNKIEMHAEVIYGDANYPPLDILKSNSYIDLPMFEFWAGHNPQTVYPEYTPSAKPEAHFPAYAATLYDKAIMGSEAYTGMAHYSESPAFLKSFGDRAFCSGINQMILHSNVHQPTELKPGMTLGQFAAHFNRHNPWFQQASVWIDYQSRIQNILQQGSVNSDILYYVGDQLPQYIENKTVNALPFGYQAIACNFDVLKNKARVMNKNIIVSDKMSFSLLVLPDNGLMELSTLQLIAGLINEGAIVYGTKPLKVLSVKGIREEKKAFQDLSDKLWGKIDGLSVSENVYGKGKVIWGKPISKVLTECEIMPDFKTNIPDSFNLMYIHKKIRNSDVYFVTNQQNAILNRECSFRVTGKAPEIWDPENGTITEPAIYTIEKKQTRIPVKFEPRQALIFVFNDSPAEEFINKVSFNGKQIFPSQQPSDNYNIVPFAKFSEKGFSYTTEKEGEFIFTTNKNKEIKENLKPAEEFEIKDFKGTIEFSPAYDAKIQPVEILDFKSWPDFDKPEIKYFSGTAKYNIKFNLPENFLDPKSFVQLSMGDFESTAEVKLNGKLLGLTWKPGHRFDVTGILKPENELEMKVANVYRNRIIGDYIEFGKLTNVWTSAPVQDFLNKNRPLKPSGMIGPVKLIKVHK